MPHEKLPDLARENKRELSPKEMVAKFFSAISQRKKQHIAGKNIDGNDSTGLVGDEISDNEDLNFSTNLSENISVITYEEAKNNTGGVLNDEHKYKIGGRPSAQKNGFIVLYDGEPIGMFRKKDHVLLQKMLFQLYIREAEAENAYNEVEKKTNQDATSLAAKTQLMNELSLVLDPGMLDEGASQLIYNEMQASDIENNTKKLKDKEKNLQETNDATEYHLHRVVEYMEEIAESLSLSAVDAKLSLAIDSMKALQSHYATIKEAGPNDSSDAAIDNLRDAIDNRGERMNAVMARFAHYFVRYESNNDGYKDKKGSKRRSYFEQDLCPLLKTNGILKGRIGAGHIRYTVHKFDDIISTRKFIKASKIEKKAMLDKLVLKLSDRKLDHTFVMYLADIAYPDYFDGEPHPPTDPSRKEKRKTKKVIKKATKKIGKAGKSSGNTKAPIVTKLSGGSRYNSDTEIGVRTQGDTSLEMYIKTDLSSQPWPVLGQLYTDLVSNSESSLNEQAKMVRAGILKKLFMGGASIGMINTPNHIGASVLLEELGKYVPHTEGEPNSPEGNLATGRKLMMEIMGEMFFKDSSIQGKIQKAVYDQMTANTTLHQTDLIYNYAGLSDDIGVKQKAVINATIREVTDFYNESLGISGYGNQVTYESVARMFYTKESAYNSAIWSDTDEVVNEIEAASGMIYDGELTMRDHVQEGGQGLLRTGEAYLISQGMDPNMVKSIGGALEATADIYETYASVMSIRYGGQTVWNFGRYAFGIDKGKPGENGAGPTYDFMNSLKQSGSHLFGASLASFAMDPSQGFNAIPFIGSSVEEFSNYALGKKTNKTRQQMLRHPTLIQTESAALFMKNTLGDLSVGSLMDYGILTAGNSSGGNTGIRVNASKLMEQQNHPRRQQISASPNGTQVFERMSRQFEKMDPFTKLTREELSTMDPDFSLQGMLDTTTARTADLNKAMEHMGILSSSVDLDAIMDLPADQYEKKLKLLDTIGSMNKKLTHPAIVIGDDWVFDDSDPLDPKPSTINLDKDNFTSILNTKDKQPGGAGVSAKFWLQGLLKTALEKESPLAAKASFERYFRGLQYLANPQFLNSHLDAADYRNAADEDTEDLYDYYVGNAAGSEASFESTSGGLTLTIPDSPAVDLMSDGWTKSTEPADMNAIDLPPTATKSWDEYIPE